MPDDAIRSPAPELEASPFRAAKKTFIVSAGRTGTHFLGSRLSRLRAGVFSVHEPDKVEFQNRRWREFFSAARAQNPLRLSVGKVLGVNGTRNLSLKRLQRRWSRERCLQRLIRERDWVPSCRLYIESNYQLFGLPEDLLFLPDTRVVFIVRQPQMWAGSWLKKKWYGDRDLLYRLNLLGLKRLTPANAGIQLPEWEDFSREEKLIWVWGFLNQSFYTTAQSHPGRAGWFRFEDVFTGANAAERRRFLEFCFHGPIEDEELRRFDELLLQRTNTTPETESDPETRRKLAAAIERLTPDLLPLLGYRL